MCTKPNFNRKADLFSLYPGTAIHSSSEEGKPVKIAAEMGLALISLGLELSDIRIFCKIGFISSCKFQIYFITKRQNKHFVHLALAKMAKNFKTSKVLNQNVKQQRVLMQQSIAK